MLTPLRFIKRQAWARPLACFSVAFLIGLIFRQRFAVPAASCLCLLIAAVALFFALRTRRGAFAALILLMGLTAGMARMAVAVDAIRDIHTRYSVSMTGFVASEPFTNPKTGRRIFRFDVQSADDEPESLSLRMYVRGDDPDALSGIAYGQELRLKGHIWAADPVTNPYEFDFGGYLNRQGLDAYATAKIEDVELVGTRRDLRSAVIEARQAVSRRIDALFPKNAGLMRALVLGDRSMLSDELRDALNDTGIAHLISISGLHVTLLAALAATVLGRFMPSRWANIAAVALLVPYGALIGFTAPFTRALVMFALLCLAPAAGRIADSITLLCAAMLAWLCVRPLSIEDTGFALSFSASAGILLVMPTLTSLCGIDALRRRKPSPRRMRRLAHAAALYLPSLICASLAAQLTTLPYVIASFGVQSVISLPVNLVCVPICVLAYVLGVIALIVSAVSMQLAMLMARAPDALFSCLTTLAEACARFPAVAVRLGRYPALLLAAHWCVVLMVSDLSRFSSARRGKMLLGFVAVALLSTLVAFLGAWRYSITFLDADQADCAVVRSHGHTWLIDAGDSYTPAADYLSATCLRLDGVVLSHPHQDHAGGLSSVLDSFTPGVIYVPKGWFEVGEISEDIVDGIERARSMGVEIRELCAGDSVPLSDAATMTVYSPVDGEPPGEVNDMSLLALIECEGQRALFTGDLSVNNEPEDIPDADVLKVAHHGSSKATSDRFIAATTPDYAIVSVGENNYGHPSPETVKRLRDSGAAVYATRDCGAITLTWTGGRWRVDTYLEASDELE